MKPTSPSSTSLVRRGVADGRQVVSGAWIEDINQRGDPEAWAASELAEIFPNGSYRNQWYRIDRFLGSPLRDSAQPVVDRLVSA
jgi:hypothetical protein